MRLHFAPLFRLTPPLDDAVRRFIANQEHAELSYPEVGASADSVPHGYTVDRNRIELGSGERVWQRAVAAVRAWQMFNIPWLRLYWPDTPIEVGAVVAVSVRHFGFFSLNACRIVYVVGEDGAATDVPVSRFGFAYGTLGEHAESGEERFTVEWDRASDKVWYDILAFSRPRHTLAKLAYPLSRSMQKAFADCSKVAMSNAVTKRV
jgi:uncharacterized protein (UPF0548 family)